jgi:HD-GYP domain-containing protein (c-di-GMP phosphodiesterase class II)
MNNLAMGLLLSEIGKAKMPVDLLKKTGQFNAFEQAIMDRHVEYSLEMLRQDPDIDEQILSIVATKNERHNGSGYPNNLAGDQIPLLGKMAGLVDTYDLLINARNPHYSIDSASALEKIYDMRSIEFQAQLIDEFIQAIGIYPVGAMVELSTNEIGIIVEQNREHRLRAKVMLILDENKNLLNKFNVIDLSKPRKVKGHKGSIEIRKSVANGIYDIDQNAIYEKVFRKTWGIKNLSIAS